MENIKKNAIAITIIINLREKFKKDNTSLSLLQVDQIFQEYSEYLQWNNTLDTYTSLEFTNDVKRLRWLKNFSFHPFIDRHIPSFLTIREKDERLILFQNWGIEDDSLINFIINLSKISTLHHEINNKLNIRLLVSQPLLPL